jgi:sugar/nucleoside kinase (ribokinase family)
MSLEMLAIGSALVDVTIAVEEDFLEREQLPKGGMTLVDAVRSEQLLSFFSESQKKLSPGGAAANVASAFAHCGGASGFIGKVGADAMGAYFHRECEANGVRFFKLPARETTGVAICFLTKDGQRTFATHLGAASTMHPSELPAELINKAKFLFIEAYLAFNKDLFFHILQTAKKNKQKIVLDLASFTVVQQNLDLFTKALNEYVDIVFANEDESQAFTGLPPKKSAEVLATLCTIAIMKEGSQGSHLATKSQVLSIPADSVIVVDTNGAGDAYAGGVLFGLLKGFPLEIAGKIGTKAGALMVSQWGARFTPENAKNMRHYVDSHKILEGRTNN